MFDDLRLIKFIAIFLCFSSVLADLDAKHTYNILAKDTKYRLGISKGTIRFIKEGDTTNEEKLKFNINFIFSDDKTSSNSKGKEVQIKFPEVADSEENKYVCWQLDSFGVNACKGTGSQERFTKWFVTENGDTNIFRFVNEGGLCLVMTDEDQEKFKGGRYAQKRKCYHRLAAESEFTVQLIPKKVDTPSPSDIEESKSMPDKKKSERETSDMGEKPYVRRCPIIPGEEEKIQLCKKLEEIEESTGKPVQLDQLNKEKPEKDNDQDIDLKNKNEKKEKKPYRSRGW